MDDEIISIDKKISMSLEELRTFAGTIKAIVKDELTYRLDITDDGDIIIYKYLE